MGNLINLRHVYISFQWLLKGMPSRFGRLICLLTLSVYVVGKDVGFGLKEMKNLTNLQDSLCISRLQNVNDVGDAEEADLISKKNLQELELIWIGSFKMSKNFEIESQVLEKLKVYQMLEKLTIRRYGGTKFPSWLGNTSFSSLVLLRFEDCKNCTSLPPIGQLPLLKYLSIIGGSEIEIIGPEFYGTGFSKPFQSLENLYIKDMKEWEYWIPLGLGKDIVGKVQDINFSMQGEADLPLELRFIVIKKCNALEPLPMSWMQSSNTSLEILSIQQCDSLTYIARVQLPPNLKKLEIIRCSSLQILVDEEKNVNSDICRNNLPLECSKIFYCQSKGNLPKAHKNLYILGCSKLESIAGSVHGNTSLETLEIQQCENLKVLPNDPHNVSRLQDFSISSCKSIVPFPDWSLPSVNLKTIRIMGCEKLDCLPSGMNNLSSLQSLSILCCPDIVSIPKDGFHINLTSLRIIDVKICKPIFEWEMHRLTSLKELYITKGCPDMISFPQEEIGMILPISLTTLDIYDFPNLERLSSVFQNLTSLEGLHLDDCPKLKFFPENGLPPSLLRLQIYGCPLLNKVAKGIKDFIGQ
ncbi:hypothetical protein Ddye_028766 [Dipteronia dyeriana]|uniref:R13L1/DRL21-like LRR repeat region domain-containing protein n=1 Tax=Dipteronia dyeriana TaxID=168575 RepID=A0AAD9WK04_9ROSI|nr:hypothetical protein Ddye_028766 [Dipteronia dyeriana]